MIFLRTVPESRDFYICIGVAKYVREDSRESVVPVLNA